MHMNIRCLLGLAVLCAAPFSLLADDIKTLDGQTYTNVSEVALQPNGLYFIVTDSDSSMRGVTVPYSNLPDDIKEKYHYDPFEVGMIYARQNRPVNLTKSLAFPLDQLDAAKKKAQDEHKMIGFIMEWDTMLVPAYPMQQGSQHGLAHFYDVFHDGMVLVFVRHESELPSVPPAVRQGFFGPEEGGFAPNMAVVTADCSQFVCEIPYGGNESNGKIREEIFRQKIAVIKEFKKAHEAAK
jgi:hypothetical protein